MSKPVIISPDSAFKKQIEDAIKPKVKLTKKQKPKIILVEETENKSRVRHHQKKQGKIKKN